MSATEAAPESSSSPQAVPRNDTQTSDHDHTTTPTSPLSELDDDVAGAFRNGAASIENGVKVEDDDDANSSITTATATTLRPDPARSIKRRESEGAVPTPELSDRANGKKRKRGVSPPWHFPTAENTTLKTADGRRISARVNPGTPVLSENDGRARSSSLSAPPDRSRPASPPWKKFEADRPTSLLVNGKRKSGRVNKELSSPEAPKRISPRSKKVELKVEAKVPERPASSHKPAPAPAPPKVKKEVNVTAQATNFDKKRAKDVTCPSAPSDSMSKIAELRAQIEALKPTRSFPSPSEQTKRSHKRKLSNDAPTEPTSPPPTHRKLQRPTNMSLSLSPEIRRPSPRIKLRLKTTRRIIPPPHPNANPPSPMLPPRLSIHQALSQHDLLELQQPYSENERGPPDMAWFAQRAERQAVEEGSVRRKILQEARPGGILSRENLSIYQDADPQPEPAKQYGHADHMVAHALHLRHLQVREKAQHRALAKKVAHEALEYWKLRRGPTEEDLRVEEEKLWRLIYKQVAVDVKAKWSMVEQYVQAERLRVWEQEEEEKRQERLKEKLEWSENLVARLRGEGGEDDDGSEEEESEEENMSASSSEASEDEEVDGGSGEMGEDELAAYLAQREAEPPDEDGPAREDASMADALEEDGIEDEVDAEAGAQGDVSMADLFGAEDSAEEEPDEEFEPEPEEEGHDAATSLLEDRSTLLRHSRRGSASPVHDQAEIEADFSSDESTDMDSEDYDSDEDMSGTGSEDHGNDEDEASDNDSDGEHPVPKNSLLSLFKDEVKTTQLPTPTTSAEGDEREREVHVEVEEEERVAAESPGDVEEVHMLRDSPRPEEKAPASDGDVEIPDAPAAAAAESPAAFASSHEGEDPTANKYQVPTPTLLRGTLRSYQHAGLDWLASLYRNGTNGILADEMGLGKTIQTIALLAHLAEEHECWETHLVIVPTSVILNWVTEFQKFLPGFRVLGYYGSAEERQAKRRGWVNDPHHEIKEKRGYNVVITSYNVAMQDINAIRNVQWHYLVLDEAHNIRNFNSQRWQVLIRLKTRARLLLTGTPLQNSLTELWSLLTFLTAGDDDPQHGDLEEFLSHWKEPVKEIFDRGVLSLSSEAQKVVDQLHVSLRPFLLRRLKAEVEKDLPKKRESVVVCKLSKRQRQLYQEYMGLADTRRSLTQGNAVTAGKVLLSLRRVCNHPDLFDPRGVVTSFGMERSVVEDFAGRERVVRRLLGEQEVAPGLFLAEQEAHGKGAMKRSGQLSAVVRLERELEALVASAVGSPTDVESLAGCQALQRSKRREKKTEQLRSCIDASKAGLRMAPIYGSDLRELLTVKSGGAYRSAIRDSQKQVRARPLHGWPALGCRPLRFDLDHVSEWMLSKSSLLQQGVQTVEKYAERLHETIVNFAFCTPAATAPVLDYIVPEQAQQALRASDSYPLGHDYAHEARMRGSIAFPDSRLLIYDSGKLQRLSRLLRDLQSRGSRSLIFTQMTGTLNILEQFLSLLNLPYLRLDGSTPVERRQLYSAEFNRPDSKYQCMILSSRAGGVGLNLIGASSVIFYDLDWNPQMDRQCMDRAHRIGQVRDVEVYKMVSEKTVEENILRRAEQKSLLDQTVIQEGHFTTEYQRQPTQEQEEEKDTDDVAAAIERFLGGSNEKSTTQALESVEDREDVQAAQQARKEEQQDDADFTDRSSKGASVQPPTPGGVHAHEDEEDESKGHVDSYMIRHMEVLLKDVPFVPPPKARKTDRHGRDPSHRPKRKR